jgi:hypothetical protein
VVIRALGLYQRAGRGCYGAMRALLLSASLLTLSAPALAEGDPAAQKAAMDAISGLVGTWTGTGWRIPPGGQRYEYLATYKVESKAGGLVYTMESAGSRRIMPNPPTPGGGSFGVITYDADAKRYNFRSFSRGDHLLTYGELLRPGVFRWSAAFEGAQLLFPVDVTGGAWMEVGERSTDGGKTWTQNYAISLAPVR